MLSNLNVLIVVINNITEDAQESIQQEPAEQSVAALLEALNTKNNKLKDTLKNIVREG